MQVYKCRICGDPYVGSAKPDYCPFCGASGKYTVSVKDWIEHEQFELSEVSKANLGHALMLENNSALFYACSYEVAMNAELAAAFKALYRIEAEHATVIRKLLGLPEPEEEEDNRGRCHALEQQNVTEAHDREARAIDFYLQSAQAAPEPRVKEVFEALAEIESTHVELFKDAVSRFSFISNPII